MMAEQRSRFAALEASGGVTPEISALFEALFAMMQMLILLLLEKRTKKTPANSSLPGSLAPFDRTTAPRSGSKSKGPGHEHGEYANVRIEVDEQTSTVDECGRCGEDLSEVTSEDHERRVTVDIEFVTRETRIDAQIKRCPNYSNINRGRFPETMPGPLQYGDGIVAFATDCMISQMLPLRRSARMLKMITGRQISEATLKKWVKRLHHALADW